VHDRRRGGDRGVLHARVSGDREDLHARRGERRRSGVQIVQRAGSRGTLRAVSEAFVLAKKLGIDPYKVRDALLGGSAQSFVLANHGKRLLDGTRQPGFRAERLLKDIKLAQSTGRDTESFMPVTALALQLLTALCNSGRDALDRAALGLLFEELSGIKR
jgi:3-hydroxyisobutyrate dehydrogenase-like beta-hydroxyacid dehydrogenase